jgi:hypothetical protein
LIVSCKFGMIEDEALTTDNEDSRAQAANEKPYYGSRP